MDAGLSETAYALTTERGDMKTRPFCLVSLVLVAALLVSGSAPRALAQDPQAPPASEPTKAELRPPDVSRSPNPRLPSRALPQATGGPDDYGYTWDDTIAFNWIDATSGTDSGLSGDDVYTGTIDIGFPFKFYENTYNQLYFNTNGLVTFGSGSYAYSNSRLPMEAPPNNLIAVLWDDLAVGPAYNSGKIYYQRGGTAPNRFFVTEWYSVTSCCSQPGTDFKTFEVILYENGDIVTQWLGLAGYLSSATVGLEDSVGVSGLPYVYNSPGLSNGKAVRFSRPGPMARVQVYRLYEGQFTHPGGSASFQIPAHNTGDLGNDVYDLTLSSAWPISAFRSDGVTPLTDTDQDGRVDTGAVSQGDTEIVVVTIQAPGGVGVGDANTATVTVRSSLDPERSKTVTLQTAIPAPFAQVYRDGYDGTMSLYLAQAGGQHTKKVAENWWGYDLSAAEAPNGNFAYLWQRGRCLDGPCHVYVSEIQYALLNRYGETVRGVSKLTDHSGATIATYDVYPAVAVAPDGRIGVLWYRYLYQSVNNSSQYNYNIFFAILDVLGNVAYGPANLTDNTAWGYPSSTPDVPGFSNTQIAATADNRFVLAWQKYHRPSGCSSNDCSLTDVYYAVRASNGSQVRGVTRFTEDTTGSSWESYDGPNLTALTGNRALLTWSRGSDGDVYYAVLDSAGNVVKDKTNLSGDGGSMYDYYPDAAQLADGKIVVAWTGMYSPVTRFAVLDAANNRIVDPTELVNPAAPTGDSYVSVAADSAGRAVLTWMDFDYYSRRNLYYALIDGSGRILTQPMIFRTSQAAGKYTETSYVGYGNTSYRSSMAAGVDGATWPSDASARAVPGGTVPIGVHYANHGQTGATGVVLTATLAPGLTYINDTSYLGPSVVGNLVTWHLPDLGFLEGGQFELHVQVSPTATMGAHYSITLSLTTNEAEASPGDNAASVDVLVASRVYLPLVMR
jgi:uncharacterized repeat protein (TIGR01451 family)